jgi:hypothetical protein
MADTRVPEIRTRFTLDGVRQAATALVRFGSEVKTALRPISDSVSRVSSHIAAVSKTAVAATRQVSSAASAAARTASSAMSSVASAGKRVSLWGGAAGAAGLTAAIRTTTEMIRQQERFSRAAGTSTRNWAAMSAAAASYGVEQDDLMGGLSALSDKIAEAQNGSGDAFNLFQSLGIPTKDQFGRLRDSVDVMQDLMDATSGMDRTRKANIFNTLMGGDAEKMAEMLSSVSRRDVDGWREIAAATGTIASPEDVQRTRVFSQSISLLKMSVKGLAAEIAQRFLPMLSSMAQMLAVTISNNRIAIADGVVAGWNRFMAVVHDVVWLIAGRRTGFENGIFEHIGRGVVLVTPALLYLKTIVTDIEALFSGNASAVQNTWILSLASQIQQATIYAKELFYALTFQDSKVVENRQLIYLREQIILTAQLIAAQMMAYVDQLKPYIVALGQAAIAEVMHVVGIISGAISSLRDLISVVLSGSVANLSPGWVKDYASQILELRAVVLQFAKSFISAFQMFQGVLKQIGEWLKPLLDLFDTDITTALLFVGLLKMSGILKAGISLVMLLGQGFAGLFGLGAGSALVGALGTVLASITAIVAAIGVGAAAGAWAGKKLYNATLKSGDDAAYNAVLGNMRAQDDAYMSSRPSRPTSSYMSDDGGIDVWGYRSSLSSAAKTASETSSPSTNIEFNFGDKSVSGKFLPNRSEFINTLRQMSRRGLAGI